MADEAGEEELTFKQKLLFYTTAFFVLLGIFSLFGFLFLVPFVIEPAFTTIMMEFDEYPASCVTVEIEHFKGASNCSWTSCREGCTKEVYECTQIRVNYKVFPRSNSTNDTMYEDDDIDADAEVADGDLLEISDGKRKVANEAVGKHKPAKQLPQKKRAERAIREYDYVEGDTDHRELNKPSHNGIEFMDYSDGGEHTGDNRSEWFFTGAKLFPNVKGCGYPPMLNCTIWSKKYKTIGTNFSCYYSRVDPGLVISDLDLKQNTLNLIFATCIPIPSFIISVIYLTFAYFKIYNDDEESVPLDKNAEEIADEEVAATSPNECTDALVPNGASSAMSPQSEQITPNSDLNSFGHQLKVKMADEMSRESLDGGFISNSGSLQGYVAILYFV